MPGYQPRINHALRGGYSESATLTNIGSINQSTNLGVRFDEVYGWDDRVDIRDVREQRPGQSGEYADNVYLSGRTITFGGYVAGSSWSDLQSKKRALAALLIPRQEEMVFSLPIYTSEPSGTTVDGAVYYPYESWGDFIGESGYEYVKGRVIESIQWGDMQGSVSQRFAFSIRCSDPRVYANEPLNESSAETSTGAVRTATITPTGDTETPAFISVSGSATAPWSITSTNGLALFFPSRSLVAGESVRVNTRDRTIDLAYSSYTNHRIAQDSLVALWPMNETSGTTADNAEGTATYDGTYAGTYTLNQSGFSTNTKSVLFPGSTGRIEIAYNANLNPNAATYEAWIKPATDPTSTRHIIDSYKSASNEGFGLRVINGSLYAAIGDGSSEEQLFTDLQDVGDWAQIHVAVTDYDFRLYVNGELKAVRNDHAYVPNSSEVIRIGQSSGGSNAFDGYISSVAIYNECMTTQQIQALVHADPDSPTESAYKHLSPAGSSWADIGVDDTTITYASNGMTASGSPLSVYYRDARI